MPGSIIRVLSLNSASCSDVLVFTHMILHGASRGKPESCRRTDICLLLKKCTAKNMAARGVFIFLQVN